MTKRALITGITGQDGSYLTELLLSKGYEVHGIKRRASSFNTQRIDHIYEDPIQPHKNLTLHYGDLSDASNLTRILANVEPDEVYNLGAQSHVAVSFETPEYTADVDALGTLRLLEAIRFLGREKHTKFYQASTSELYGLVRETPQSEITRGLANISLGLENCLYMGNIHAKRDWGHAKDYVRMQWLMLQQDTAEDYVIASGVQHSVKDFILWASAHLGIHLRFEGDGLDEVAIVESVDTNKAPALKAPKTR